MRAFNSPAPLPADVGAVDADSSGQLVDADILAAFASCSSHQYALAMVSINVWLASRAGVGLAACLPGAASKGAPSVKQ